MTARQAVHIPDDVPGTATPWGDLVTEVLAAPLSAGALCCLSVRLSTAVNRPAYVHHRCDEAVYVLSGRVTISVGERRLTGLEPGSCVYIPRGLSRSFSTTGAGARLLITLTPAEDLDEALAALAEEAHDAHDLGLDRLGGAYQPSARLIQAMSASGIELITQPAVRRPVRQQPL